MRHYVSENNVENRQFDIDRDVFGDVELVGNLMQFKHINRRFLDSVGVGGSFLAAPLVFDGNLYAVSPEGKLLWTFHTNGKIMCSPASHDGMVFVGSNDGNVYCIDARTGNEIWRFSTNGPQNAPLIYDNKVLFGQDDNVFYCLDMNGKLIWKYAATATINAWPPAAHDGIVYFGCYDNRMRALDVNTGKLVWEYKINGVVYPACIYNGMIYFGSRDNSVYCLDAKKGVLIWRFKTNGIVLMATPYDGVVYFGSYDNNFYAVDAYSGKELWRFKTNGFISFNTICDGRVYFGNWDCNLYCLDIDGKLLWRFHSSMSSPSEIKPPEPTILKTLELTWRSESGEKRKEGSEEAEIRDYGSFSGAYIEKDKSDYVSSGKRSYMKKREF